MQVIRQKAVFTSLKHETEMKIQTNNYVNELGISYSLLMLKHNGLVYFANGWLAPGQIITDNFIRTENKLAAL